MTHSTPQGRITSSESQLPSFDPSVPNPARMWNYWLGGKDNFAADREAAGSTPPSAASLATAAWAESHKGLPPTCPRLVSYQGPLPAGYADQPAPDPAAFELPAQDDGSRDDPGLARHVGGTR